MKWRIAVAALITASITLVPQLVYAQAVTSEADITVGRSTDGTNAAATQVRLFGATKSDWRGFIEASWGQTSSAVSDAFSSAYPYDRRVRAMDAFVERTFHPGGALVGVRTGRYRTPFGISGRSEYAYSGFVRAPLIRYGDGYALSNTSLEAGADVIVGTPSLSVETSIGRPFDEGEGRRPAGVDIVVRGQTYYHSFIIGASVLRSNPSMPGDFVQGRMRFEGLDARWMHAGVQIRGEWLFGHPFDGVTTRGGYLDVIVHHLGMGPFTVVGRMERQDYFAGPFSQFLRRFTAGSRIRFNSALSAQINVLGQPGGFAAGRRVALDASLTLSRRF